MTRHSRLSLVLIVVCLATLRAAAERLCPLRRPDSSRS